MRHIVIVNHRKVIETKVNRHSFYTWFEPTSFVEDAGGTVTVRVPNPLFRDWLTKHYSAVIDEAIAEVSRQGTLIAFVPPGGEVQATPHLDTPAAREAAARPRTPTAGLNPRYTFRTFVVGSSNQFANAASRAVAEAPSRSYNPLFIYGGVGLGKTHLMQAVGNHIREHSPNAKVVYLHSQRFVQDMVQALKQGTMQEFMQFYRSIDALLIDDIQFFAKKLRSQEEFFHVFNGLLERGHQMVLTCDRYPREIDGLEERLKSRFVWGLTVEVEPPELETRVAILMKKAEAEEVDLDPAVAFFIGERIRSNVRELEGALRRVIANARFTGSLITIEQVKRALRDLFAIQERLISIDNIQRKVAEYYNIKISDILSKRRNRTIARPRQMAMYLAKEHTNHSLPEIGDAFGGRDHTTVLHACRKIAELREGSADVAEDYRNLNRLLSS